MNNILRKTPATPPARNRRGGLVQEAVQHMASQIQGGRLKPGDQLPTESAIMAEVAVIIAGPKHMPVATYLPFTAHHQHALIVRKQAAAGEPTKKRIWQQIVQAKIENQGAVLAGESRTGGATIRQEFAA